MEEDENNENAGEDGENDFSPSDDEELANLLEEGDEGEDEDSDADEEVELILGDSKYLYQLGNHRWPCPLLNVMMNMQI